MKLARRSTKKKNENAGRSGNGSVVLAAVAEDLDLTGGIGSAWSGTENVIAKGGSVIETGTVTGKLIFNTLYKELIPFLHEEMDYVDSIICIMKMRIIDEHQPDNTPHTKRLTSPAWSKIP